MNLLLIQFRTFTVLITDNGAIKNTVVKMKNDVRRNLCDISSADPNLVQISAS